MNFAYAVGTDGKATEIQNPYFLKTLDKRLDQLKSKRDTCKKRSKLITRADGSQFCLPSRRWLMLNARLQEVYRKRRFKHVLAWVALRSGKQFLEWEEGGSTRTCHDCGFVVAEGIPCPGRREVSSRRAWRFNGLGLTIRGPLTGSATGTSFQEIKSAP